MSFKGSLDLQPYIDAHMLVEGEQRSYNHDDCPNGKDTKRRLYLKRVKDGYVGYCHHCGQSGSNFKGSISTHIKAISSVLENSEDVEEIKLRSKAVPIPDDLTLDISQMPRDIALWLAKSGITLDELRGNTAWLSGTTVFNAGYSPSNGGFVMQTNAGWQLRTTVDKQKQGYPKYLTFRDRDNASHVSVYAPKSASIHRSPYDKVILVEDFLSAIKVLRHGYCTMWLCGVNNTDNMTDILTGYAGKQVLVMLDNDKPEIRMRAEAIRLRVRLLGLDCVVLNNPTDPKHMTYTQIEALINT